MQIRRYAGLLDDSLTRETISAPDLPQYLHLQLVKSAIFSEPIFINDGYIVHDSYMRNEAFNPDSLLSSLIRSGHAKVLCRSDPENGDFSRSISNNALNGVDSAKAMLAVGAIFERELSDFSARLIEAKSYERWPSQGYAMSESLVHLLRGVYDGSIEKYGIRDISGGDFRNFLQESVFDDPKLALGGVRSRIRGTASHWLRNKKMVHSTAYDINRLLDFIYHLNFAMILSPAFGKVECQTFIHPGFEEYFRVGSFAETRAPGRVFMTVPSFILNADPVYFQELLNADSVAYSRKTAFLSAVRRWSQGDPSIDEAALDEVSNAYIDELSRIFKGAVGLGALGRTPASNRLARLASLCIRVFLDPANHAMSIALEIAQSGDHSGGSGRRRFLGVRSDRNSWASDIIQNGLTRRQSAQVATGFDFTGFSESAIDLNQSAIDRHVSLLRSTSI